MSMTTRAGAWAMVAALSIAAPRPLWAALDAPPQPVTEQTTTSKPPPNPADPGAVVPAMTYRSPFTGLRRLGTPDVTNWRDNNDLVLQRGGWRQYARQAQGVQTPASPASSPHAGHGKQ